MEQFASFTGQTIKLHIIFHIKVSTLLLLLLLGAIQMQLVPLCCMVSALSSPLSASPPPPSLPGTGLDQVPADQWRSGSAPFTLSLPVLMLF